jgi:hypothetical protein
MAKVRQLIFLLFLLLLDPGSERSGIRDGKKSGSRINILDLKNAVVPDPLASNIELHMIRFSDLGL